MKKATLKYSWGLKRRSKDQARKGSEEEDVSISQDFLSPKADNMENAVFHLRHEAPSPPLTG